MQTYAIGIFRGKMSGEFKSQSGIALMAMKKHLTFHLSTNRTKSRKDIWQIYYSMAFHGMKSSLVCKESMHLLAQRLSFQMIQTLSRLHQVREDIYLRRIHLTHGFPQDNGLM